MGNFFPIILENHAQFLPKKSRNEHWQRWGTLIYSPKIYENVFKNLKNGQNWSYHSLRIGYKLQKISYSIIFIK